MKKKYLSLLAACSFLFAGCSDFLDMNPNGILDEESVSGVEQLDKLVISAYSMLGNDHYDIPLIFGLMAMCALTMPIKEDATNRIFRIFIFMRHLPI